MQTNSSSLGQLLTAMHLLLWMQLSFESLSLTLLFQYIQKWSRKKRQETNIFPCCKRIPSPTRCTKYNTRITHHTDQNYEYFKLMYSSNLEKLVQYCHLMNDSVRQTDIPLLVFGKQGQREEHKQLMLEPLFDNALSVERSVAV